MEKPKRPLSSFNLFYRYKRALVLSKVGEDPSREDVLKILSASAGMEEEANQQPPFSDEINTLRRYRIREALKDKILPTDNGRRRHRKAANSLGISFSEMGKLMTTSWKDVDSFAKGVFEELSTEGRRIYFEEMNKFNKLNSKEPNSKSAPDNAQTNNTVETSEKESVSLLSPHQTAIPTVATYPAVRMHHGQSNISIPAHMAASNAAVQSIPYNMLPTVQLYNNTMSVSQYASCNIAPIPPVNTNTNNAKSEESKPSRSCLSKEGDDSDANATAAAETITTTEQKREQPFDFKRSLPLKKRFKRP